MDISRAIRYQMPCQASGMPCQASGQTAKQVWNVYTLKTARGSFLEIGIPVGKRHRQAASVDEDELSRAAEEMRETASDCGFPAQKF